MGGRVNPALTKCCIIFFYLYLSLPNINVYFSFLYIDIIFVILCYNNWYYVSSKDTKSIVNLDEGCRIKGVERHLACYDHAIMIEWKKWLVIISSITRISHWQITCHFTSINKQINTYYLFTQLFILKYECLIRESIKCIVLYAVTLSWKMGFSNSNYYLRKYIRSMI